MSSLLVGFDSAWTPGNCGAIAVALRRQNRDQSSLSPLS